MVLSEWPLNANGKVDRKRLPEPSRSTECYVFDMDSYSVLEGRIAGLFASVLDVEDTSINPELSFIDLGGHSLLSISVVSKIRKEFQVQISLSEFMSNSSVFALASLLELTLTDMYNDKVLDDVPVIQKTPVLIPWWWWTVEVLIILFLLLIETIVTAISFYLALMIPHKIMNLQGVELYYMSSLCLILMPAILSSVVWLFFSQLTRRWLVVGDYDRFSATYLLSNFMQRMNDIHSLFLTPFLGTSFLNWYLRCLGAKIGNRCYIYSLSCEHWHLLDIGDDVCVQPRTAFHPTFFNNDQYHLRNIIIGDRAVLGSRSVIVGQVTIENNAILAPLSHCSGRDSLLTIPTYSVPVGSWTYLMQYWYKYHVGVFLGDGFQSMYLNECPSEILRAVFGLNIGHNSFLMSSISSIELPHAHLEIGHMSMVASDIIIGAAEIIEGRWILNDLVISDNVFAGNRAVVCSDACIPSQFIIGSMTEVNRYNLREAASGEVWLGQPPIRLSEQPESYGSGLTATSFKVYLSWIRLTLGDVSMNLLAELVQVVVIVLTLMIQILFLYERHNHAETSSIEHVSMGGVYFVILITFFLLETVIDMLMWTLFMYVVENYFRPSWTSGEEGRMLTGLWMLHRQCYYHIFQQWNLFVGRYFVGTYTYSQFLRLFGTDWAATVLCRSTHGFDELAVTHVGRGVVIEPGALLQGHTFEFGVMKLGHVVVGDGSYIGHDSLLLPGARLDSHVTLDSGTLILRGEEIPMGTHWGGSPARSIRRGNVVVFEESKLHRLTPLIIADFKGMEYVN
eukprot:gene11139-23280_t